MDSAETLLAELIAIPSVNPAFLPPGDRRAGEANMAGFLASEAAAAGLAVQMEEIFPERFNLLARLLPAGKIKHRVLLAPHLDTVGDAQMPDKMFQSARKRGNLHGRGACDTKGSIAAMFTALLEIARGGERPTHTEIIFAGLIDEENGQEGSRALAKSGLKADLAIVGEPTELRVVTAHKGDLWLKLVTKGKAAHGARPELGVNAVYEAARIVEALELGYSWRLGDYHRMHPVLGSPTINTGAIHGGTQPNIVPDRCEILIDRRTVPGEKDEKVRREILRFIRSKDLDAEIINYKQNPALPMETNPKLPFVREFMAMAGQKTALGVDYFCDASVLSSGGIPSVVFGPGNIAQAHTADEWIDLDSLEEGTRMIANYLRSLP